jgi:hypothetical protein
VTSTDFLTSSPIAVDADRCYLLRVFHRSADNGQGTLRLQVNWIDREGHELDAITAGICVVATRRDWQVSTERFHAPAEAKFAVVYAVAQTGKVWVDDYSLRQLVEGCEIELTAIPNPVPLQALNTTGRSAVVWNTHGRAPSHLHLSVNGGPETLFANEGKGSKILDGVRPGSSYRLRLFFGTDQTDFKSLDVSTEVASVLAVAPVVLDAGSGVGKTIVTWNMPGPSEGEVYVAVDGGPEQLFAHGVSGSQAAPWILPASHYEFRCYTTENPRRLLAKVAIPGQSP